MSILFRIAVPADDTLAPVAVITARQLASLRRVLRAEGDRIGIALIEPDDIIGDSFEVRVCPLALVDCAEEGAACMRHRLKTMAAAAASLMAGKRDFMVGFSIFHEADRRRRPTSDAP